MAAKYFAPYMVLQSEERIGLTADQKTAVEELVEKAKSKIESESFYR